MTTDHRPIPGPSYWDWRCLVCSEPVADHPSLLRRIVARIKHVTDRTVNVWHYGQLHRTRR